MSLAALLKATRDHLRSLVPLSEDQCRVMPDGQPHPAFGDSFVAVHPTTWATGDLSYPGSGLSLDEVYGLSCTVTWRAPLAPVDRFMDDLYLASVNSLEILCRKVIKHINYNWTLIVAANTNIATASTDKFVEALFWQGGDAAPRLESPMWVWSKAENQDLVAALVMEMRFGGARRVQASTRGVE